VDLLKLERKPGTGRHFTVFRGKTWLGDLDWKSRWPRLMNADATIAVASGYYDLRTRRGRPVMSFGGEEVASRRSEGTFTGAFDSFRLDGAVSGWAIVGMDGQLRLDAFRNGDSFDIEAAPDAKASQLPLLILFTHYVWQASIDKATRWGAG